MNKHQKIKILSPNFLIRGKKDGPQKSVAMMIMAIEKKEEFVFQVAIPLEKQESVYKILSYPFSQVKAKILKDGRLSEELVDEAINEFRKYLILILLGYKGIGMISKEVDEVWHTFILFTRDYAAFCEDVFGYFVHHQPDTPVTPINKKVARAKFIKAYTTVFGELHPIWKGGSVDCIKIPPGECAPSTNCQDPDCSWVDG